jgi:hypothetical protein
VLIESGDADFISRAADEGVLQNTVLDTSLAQLLAQLRHLGDGQAAIVGEDGALHTLEAILDFADDQLLFRLSSQLCCTSFWLACVAKRKALA